jgi:hypothetical protein
MVLPELGIGKAIIGVIARKVVESGIVAVADRLTSSDVERALEKAFKKAQEEVGELTPSLSADRQDWLEKIFQDVLGSGVGLEELRRPMTEGRKPEVGVLRVAFEDATANRKISISPECLLPWLQCFVESYFEQTNVYLRYRAKRRDYLENTAISGTKQYSQASLARS